MTTTTASRTTQDEALRQAREVLVGATHGLTAYVTRGRRGDHGFFFAPDDAAAVTALARATAPWETPRVLVAAIGPAGARLLPSVR